MRTTRLMDFAGGMKCSIVSAPAPLPLTAPNAGVYAPNVAGHTGPAAFNRGTPSNRRRGRCPHRPAVRSGCFFRPAQGAASPTPRDRCKRSYISKYERQRRRMADNTAFRPRPTENPANQPERKSRNHWFLAAFFGYFLSLVKESNPPAAYISRFSLPFPH